MGCLVGCLIMLTKMLLGVGVFTACQAQLPEVSKFTIGQEGGRCLFPCFYNQVTGQCDCVPETSKLTSSIQLAGDEPMMPTREAKFLSEATSAIQISDDEHWCHPQCIWNGVRCFCCPNCLDESTPSSQETTLSAEVVTSRSGPGIANTEEQKTMAEFKLPGCHPPCHLNPLTGNCDCVPEESKMSGLPIVNKEGEEVMPELESPGGWQCRPPCFIDQITGFCHCYSKESTRNGLMSV